jgi:predicted DNA-binding transcriptional regulator AlpA
MSQRIRRHLPLVGSIGVLEDITGLSKSTLRRLEKSDPDFPPPFKFNEKSDRQWVVAELLSYLERKAGRPLDMAA